MTYTDKTKEPEGKCIGQYGHCLFFCDHHRRNDRVVVAAMGFSTIVGGVATNIFTDRQG